jgi:hypothetical protein
MARNTLIMGGKSVWRRSVVQARRRSCGRPLTSSGAHGGIMHLKRTIIIPAIMALSAVGSVLAGSAVTLAATSAPSAVVATASHVHPDFVYNG